MIRPAITVALVLLSASPALAVVDPVGDFLATHSGAQSADIDLIAAEMFTLSGNRIGFSAGVAGIAGTTPGASYVFGVDRGAGLPGLFTGVPPVGPGVTFDAVVVVRSDGTGVVTAFNDGAPPTVTQLDSSAIVLDGSLVAAFVDIALLPSRGFALEDYRFNVWSRSGGGNIGIADLAQDSGTFGFETPAGAIPEPSSWALMIAGFGLAGGALRRRRTLGVPA
jgi:hypothetical protein